MRLVDNLLIFGRLLRRAGVHVHAGRVAELARALGYVDLGARDDVYHACRALLVHRQDQIAVFDTVFAAFWREHHDGHTARQARGSDASEPRASVVQIEDVVTPDADDGLEGTETAPERRLKVWSDAGGLASKDFAAFTAEELADAHAALSRLV